MTSAESVIWANNEYLKDSENHTKEKDPFCFYGHKIYQYCNEDDDLTDYAKEKIGIKGKGAYLALNSWGNEWGNEGYFWISYEDYFVDKWCYGATEVVDATINIAKNENVEITLDKYDYDYSPLEGCKPKVTVKYNGEVYKEGVDYTVEYINNTNAERATAKITGINRFRGTVEKTFKIHKLDLSKCQYSFSYPVGFGGYEYDGTEKRPDVCILYVANRK